MFELKCHGCGTVGAVNKVTAGLRCSCGSRDLDLNDASAGGFAEWMGVKVASPQHPSGGTGFDDARPDPLQGWSEYPGPHPGFNPMSNDEPASPECPTCKGSGKDIRDNRNNGICRECKGTGHMTPTTTPQPTQDASSGPNKTTVPFFSSLAARCPLCRTAKTQLVPDHREHAWWRCASCGPLADLDVQCGINPFLPSTPFTPQRGFTSQGSTTDQPDGRVLRLFATVAQTNPGLTQREALGLVRRTIAHYGE